MDKYGEGRRERKKELRSLLDWVRDCQEGRMREPLMKELERRIKDLDPVSSLQESPAGKRAEESGVAEAARRGYGASSDSEEG